VIGLAGTGVEPLVVVVEAAEELREPHLTRGDPGRPRRLIDARPDGLRPGLASCTGRPRRAGRGSGGRTARARQ
jgi:hypothetical protein